jgi:uroporphyrinogen-III synthase
VSAPAGPPAPLAGLAGKVILVTRPQDQAAGLSTRLRELGATPIEGPTIRIEMSDPGGPLDDAVRDAAAGRFAWVVFTSAAGVAAWFERAQALGEADPRARLAAVGDGTAEALRGRGLEPELVPDTFTTAALGDAFPRGEGSVLLARADRAGTRLDDTLREKGWTPVPVEAYRTRLADELPEAARRVLDGDEVDGIVFTSASTVEGFVRARGAAGSAVRGSERAERTWGRAQVVCIGPVTADAARAAGFEVAAVAVPHTIEGVVEALRRALE